MKLTRIERQPLMRFHHKAVHIVRVNTDIVARLLCAALMLYSPLAALTMPDSLSGIIRASEGIYSFILFSAMTFISIGIFVDIFANSVLPNSLGEARIPWLARHRDSFYLSSAFCAVMVPFSISKITRMDFAAVYLYSLILVGSLALAWCDAYAKRNTTEKKNRRDKIPL